MKKIWLIITLVIIVGAIWYLESAKVHPGATGTTSAPQAINLPSTVPAGTSTASANENASGSNSATTNPETANPNAAQALADIAAADKQAGYQPAIEIVDPTGFINVSSTFTLGSLIGKKVILLDFWTYSCINCIRTLPYLTSWYQKYQNQGLVVVGIHTPEFDFEKDIANVTAATKQYGITYPVVLDSNYGTWTAYGNLYWPHEYLIDIAGYIVHDHVGEGDYDTTEGIIQSLLKQRAMALGSSTIISTSTVTVEPANLSGINSPETYFGAARNTLLADGNPETNGVQVLTAPTSIAPNELYLDGSWNFDDQYATNNAAGAKIIYEYDSGKVFFVASGAATGTTVQVMQDGKPISAADSGSDVKNGVVTITGSRLYSIINNADGSGEHTLELIVNSPGLQAFTFTFG
jgi:thiol-disulfide isomerase/thioredoxin